MSAATETEYRKPPMARPGQAYAALVWTNE
jgi:hypothetical protein